MAASDLLLGKAGNGSVFEAINAGLPSLGFDSLPGIECRTAAMIEQRQIGCWVRRQERLSKVMDNLFSHPKTLQNFTPMHSGWPVLEQPGTLPRQFWV